MQGFDPTDFNMFISVNFRALPWSILFATDDFARKGAKIIGTPDQRVLPGLQGKIMVAERFLPSFFFVRFVAFVVNLLVPPGKRTLT